MATAPSDFSQELVESSPRFGHNREKLVTAISTGGEAIPIAINCNCGHTLRVKEEFAGRKIRCSQCRELLAIPAPSAKEVDDEDVLAILQSTPDAEPGLPSARSRTEPYIPYESEPLNKPRPDPPPNKPQQSQKKPAPRSERTERREGPAVVFEPGWFGSMNSGVVGGILMILIAVVWFVAGLAAGRIYFYPPILAVIGAGAIVKGLMGRD